MTTPELVHYLFIRPTGAKRWSAVRLVAVKGEGNKLTVHHLPTRCVMGSIASAAACGTTVEVTFERWGSVISTFNPTALVASALGALPGYTDTLVLDYGRNQHD